MSKKDKKAEKKADKRKKHNDQEQKRLLSMSETELIKEGDSCFDAGDIRDAIKLYQIAIKQMSSKLPNSASSNTAQSTKFAISELKSKLFIAYITRANELKNKNMLSEAKAMEKQAMASIPNPSCLDIRGMAFFLKLSTPEDAFKSYNEFYIKKSKQPSLDLALLERILAEILIQHNCWEKVGILSDELLIKKDAPVVKSAALFMDSGDWDAALESMKSISRSSPFAHIRLFCKAMSAFYKDNDKEMLKAISMIPKDSMLIKITDTLKYGVNDNRLNIKSNLAINKSSLAIKKCLWRGPFDIYDKLENIITNAKKENYNDYLQKNIVEFATLLMPEHTDSVIQFILETLYQLNSDKEHQFLKMAEKLLKKKGKLFRLKRDAIFTVELFFSGLEYFQYLEDEFTTLEEQKMAKSMLIYHIASTIFADRAYGVVARIIKKEPRYAMLFGIKSKDGDVATLEMIAFGVNIDPENSSLYDLALKIPALSNECKKVIETIAIAKCEAFPDDPEPLLQIASLYHAKNAYRKAESALQKALELAPHDSRVLDLHVISLLISADKSAAKKKFNLSLQDVDKAKRFNSKQCAILIAEKSIFYKIAENSQANPSEIEEQFSLFSLSEKLKCYALLMADMEYKLRLGKFASLPSSYRKSNKVSKNNALTPKSLATDPYSVVALMLKDNLKRLDELTSWDILNLLLPLPKDWIHLFTALDLFTYFDLNSNKLILKRLEDRDFLTLIEKNDDYRAFNRFIEELNNRIKAANKGKVAKKKNSSNRSLNIENSKSDNKTIENSKPDSKTIENSKLDSKILEFYKVTLKNILQTYRISDRVIYNEYSELISNLDPETEKILKDASIRLSKKTTGRFKDALETFRFDILLHPPMMPHNLFDDEYDDYYDDDDSEDDDFDPFSSKGGFNPFALPSELPNDFDLSEIPPFVLKMVQKDLKKLLNTPEGREIKDSLDEAIVELEELVDKRNLRGKSDKELNETRKKLLKERDYKMKIMMINVCYKEEAMKKFSKEAKILFII
ncbi:MAG: hypothetical protein HQK63_01440 [Desulfamplus sp.]|nr:hypothetical protein [Desulfamplus sp.]